MSIEAVVFGCLILNRTPGTTGQLVALKLEFEELAGRPYITRPLLEHQTFSYAVDKQGLPDLQSMCGVRMRAHARVHVSCT